MKELTLSEVAARTNQKYSTVHTHLKKGVLKAEKKYLGKKPLWFITEEEVNRYQNLLYDASKNKVFKIALKISIAINESLGQDVCEQILEETNEEMQKKIENIIKEEFDIISLS